jgi:hypothetical protein
MSGFGLLLRKLPPESPFRRSQIPAVIASWIWIKFFPLFITT